MGRTVGIRRALVGSARPPPVRALAGGRRLWADAGDVACIVVVEAGRAGVEAIYD